MLLPDFLEGPCRADITNNPDCPYREKKGAEN
jgi:hypothetical protein